MSRVRIRFYALFAWLVFGLISLLLPESASAATLPPGFVESSIGGAWSGAVGVTFDEVGTMYQWDRDGRVWVFDGEDRLPTPLLDIREEVGSWRDHGMLGFALHPQFRQNGYFYVMYVVDHHHLAHYGTPSYNPNADEFLQATIGRITRYTARASDNFRSVDPASRRVLVGETASTGFPILSVTHGVGTLLFGTDGTLLASCGDGAATSDSGSDPLSYYVAGLAEGIIRPKENIGAFRSQLVDCLNGKVIRIDPMTGDGISSNPFFDSANPRAPRSRVWVLGLRQPFKMTVKPESGSHNPADGRPGTIYMGDVGEYAWEEMNVISAAGQNFGWPLYEGLTVSATFDAIDHPNQDAPNPLFDINGCSQQYFTFRNLFREATLGVNSWPNPCDSAQEVPATIAHFTHTRPQIDWMHATGPARVGTYSGTNATVINVGAAGSPVSGSQFAGNCAVGGIWYRGDHFPAQYKNTYFLGDLGGGWIRNLVFDTNDVLVAVRTFASGTEEIVGMAVHPITGELFYVLASSGIFKIRYGGNAPPKAVATANVTYGPAPLTVQFNGGGSTDPEGLPLTYRWDFNDATPVSTQANPTHVFDVPAGTPTRYDVTLTVTDSAGATNAATLIVSANNTPPSATIVSPAAGTLYPMSAASSYNLIASVSDAEHAAADLRFTWRTDLHHNTHVHPGSADTNQTTSTVISPVGCDGELYFYRVNLTVSDPAGLSTSTYVDLYPSCANTAPAISDIANQSIIQGGSTGPIGFTVGDAETSAANLVVSAVSSNTAVVPNVSIVLGGSGANRTVTVTAAAGQSGTATVRVTVSDGLLSASDTFDVVVNPGVNTPPTISDITDGTINQDSSTGPIGFSIADAQSPAGSLTLSGSSSNPALVPNGNIVFGGTGGSRTLTVTPAAGQSGTATITVTVSDGVLSASDGFVLTVTSNAAPTYLFTEGFEGPGYENSDWIEDGAVNEDYTTGPLDGAQSLNFSGSQVALRSMVASNEFYMYFQVRWLSWVGYRSLITWDGGAWNTMASLYTENNVLRIAHGGIGVNGTTVISPNTTYHVWVEWTRGTGNNGTMKLYVSPSGAKPSTPDASITTGNGGIVRRMVLGALGGGNVVMDRLLLDDVAIGSQGGAPPNQPPTISDIANQTIAQDGSTGPIGFTVGDAETPVGNLVVSAVSSNTALVPNANIVLGGSGASRTLNVTPAAGQSGMATIRVTVSDGVLSISDTFDVVVSPAINTPPTISDITDRTINEDSNTGAIGFTVGDSESLAGTLTLSGSSSNPALVPNANIVFGGSGGSRTITITPAPSQSGTATITVTVSDGVLTVSDTFIVTVNAVNDAPTIGNIADQSILENTSTGPLSFSVADVDNAAGSLTLSGSSSNPALVPSANIVFGGSGGTRTVIVTPATNQSGTATITVTVSDGVLSASDTFVVTVTSSSAPTYLFTEGFEGPGYENSDWFEDGAVNEDYTTVALDGAQSLNFSDSELALRSLEVGDEFYTYFQVRWLTWVGYRSLISWDDGAWNVMASLYTENNVLRIAHGDVGINGTTVISPNTPYHVWVEWTRGTGNNGTMKLYLSQTGVKPSTPDASLSTGNGGIVRRMVLGALGGGNVVMDRLLVDDVSIGSQTSPVPQGLFAVNPGRLTIRKEPSTAAIIIGIDADSSETYVIETSEDMRAWEPLVTLPVGAQYKDSEADIHHRRFYRARKLQ